MTVRWSDRSAELSLLERTGHAGTLVLVLIVLTLVSAMAVAL